MSYGSFKSRQNDSKRENSVKKTEKFQLKFRLTALRWRPRERGRKGRMCRTMQGVQLPSQVPAVHFIKPTWRMRMIEYKEYHRRQNRVSTMGRTIIIEESVGDYISSLYGKHKWQIGLIIGQVSAS